MASSLIGSLRVALGLDTAQFEAGANKARSTARGLSRDIESSFKSAKAAVEGLVAAFAIGALTNQIKQSLEYAAAIGTVASTLGVTTKQLQEYRYAAGQVGVAQSSLETGLQRLTVSIGKAEVGSTAQIKAFNAIGVSVQQLKGKNTGQVFELIADGLKNVTDRSQRAAIEVALFGRAGAELDSLLSGGTRQLNALGQAAQQLGIVLSDDQIKNAEVTAHKLEALKEVLSAQIAGVVTQNANSILALSSALATLTGQVIKFLNSNPQLALGVIGGLAGSRFGVVGAALGAAGGAIAGDKLGQVQRDSNTDLTFRTQQMRAAQQEYISRLNEQNSGSIFTVRHGNAGSGPTLQSARDEFYRQLGLLKNATAQAGVRPAARPGTNLPQFLAPGGGGRTGTGRQPPQDRTEQDEFEFAQQQRRIDLEILDAKKSLSHDYVEQTAITLQMLDIQEQIKDADIGHKVAQAKRDYAEGKITKGTLDQIVLQADIEMADEAHLTDLQKRAVIDDALEQQYRDGQALVQQGFDLQKQRLQLEDQLTTTAQERRDVELKLLAAATAQEKARLEAIIADKQSTAAEKLRAQNDLAALGANYPLQQQAVIQQTRGPLEDYVAKLPDTVAKFNEAVQTLEVQGIDGLLDDITQLQGGFKSLLKSLLNTALQFAQGMAKAGLERGLAPLLQSLVGKTVNLTGNPGIPSFASFLGGGGGGGSGVVDLTGPQFAGSFPSFAGGGSFMFRGLPGVDRNTLSLNNIPIAKVSYGETAFIGNDNSPSPGGRGAPQVAMTVVTPNADSFNRSGRQVVRSLRRKLV